MSERLICPDCHGTRCPICDGTGYAPVWMTHPDPRAELLDGITGADLVFFLPPSAGWEVASGQRRPGESLPDAARRLLPGCVSSPIGGASGLRIWHADSFAGLDPTPMADAVLPHLGYRHPSGWRGPVGLSAEEPRAGRGWPGLPAAVTERLVDLITGAGPLPGVGGGGDR